MRKNTQNTHSLDRVLLFTFALLWPPPSESMAVRWHTTAVHTISHARGWVIYIDAALGSYVKEKAWARTESATGKLENGQLTV